MNRPKGHIRAPTSGTVPFGKGLVETLRCMYLLWSGIFVVVMEWPFSEQQAMLDVHGVECLLTVSERCYYWLTYSACSVGKNIEGGRGEGEEVTCTVPSY